MSLEELESLWQKQPVGTATAAEAERVARQLKHRLGRRSLYLKLLLACTLVGLVLELEPLFWLLRSHFSTDGVGFAAALVKFICHQVLYAALVVFLICRLRQHAQQVRASGESIRTAFAMSLAGVETEMHDYRRAAWFAVPAMALMIWSAYLNQAVAREGLAAFWPRSAFVIGFATMVTAIARHYYRTQLGPERKRLRELVGQWES
jgi:hypothetical protein